MNYFATTPDDHFVDLEYTKKVLQQDYFPVNDNLRFGDVLMFETTESGVFHAAVYVADDVVYTKNGGHFTKPWVLMKYDDLLASYPSEQLTRVRAYRLKREF